MSGDCLGKDEHGQPEWTLKLNKYQRDNLLWLINVCHEVDPFTIANNGDWIGELLWMISDSGKLEEGDVPNGGSVEDAREEVQNFLYRVHQDLDKREW